jgi:hypothetical protein
MNKSFLSKYSPWIILVIFCYTSAFLYLFIENFIFSSSLDLTPLREVDDYAFQLSLRSYHEHRKFFNLYDYSYGWIFWFPLVCLTYPFYFLSVYFGIDTPLVVFPRQLSLVFTMGTAFVLYKITSIYTKDSFTKAVILLLYLSFPVNGYFATKFGSGPQTMFLSSLAFYIAARKEFLTQKDLYKIAIIVAASGATKLSGLLITPAIMLVILDRLSWKLNKENIISLIKSFLVFVVSLAALSQIPIKVVLKQIKTTQTSYGDVGIYDSFMQGIVYPNLHISIFLITASCLAYKAITSIKNDTFFYKRDYLYILLTLIIAIIYLLLTIKMGAAYITIYFTVISFLLPLGLLALNSISTRFRYIAGVLFLSTSIFLNFNSMFPNTVGALSWNIFYVKNSSSEIKEALAIRESLKTKLKQPSEYKDNLKILKHYQAPSPYSSFRKNVLEVTFFSNIHLMLKRYDYDLIGLYKKSTAFLPDAEFNDLVQRVDPEIAMQYQNDREAIKNFLLEKKINNINYEILLETENYIYYKRQS